MNTTEVTLELFNERVERLKRSALAQRMAHPHYRLDYDRMMKRQWISADGVTEDSVDAFVLNVRLLVQDTDGFSIRRLAEDVYHDNSVPHTLRSRFGEQRQKWCSHIDARSPFTHFAENRNYTNGELFDILMYGGLAHVNRDKVRLFRALTQRGAFSSLVFASFLNSLSLLLQIAKEIHEINAELLRHSGCR